MCASFMLQISCVLLPVLGTLFSAACMLFTAAAGILLRRRAILVYLGAGFLTLAVSPRYALEFLLTTGFAGLTLGLHTAHKNAHPLLISGLGMFCGLCSLTYLLGTTTFGGVFAGLPLIASLPVFAVFSAAYPALCRYVLRHVMEQKVFRLSVMNHE
jgi:hypothetical protein